jgi:PEP-CTERM motif
VSTPDASDAFRTATYPYPSIGDDRTVTVTETPFAAPEPSTLSLVSLGLLALARTVRSRRRVVEHERVVLG